MLQDQGVYYHPEPCKDQRSRGKQLCEREKDSGSHKDQDEQVSRDCTHGHRWQLENNDVGKL